MCEQSRLRECYLDHDRDHAGRHCIPIPTPLSCWTVSRHIGERIGQCDGAGSLDQDRRMLHSNR